MFRFEQEVERNYFLKQDLPISARTFACDSVLEAEMQIDCFELMLIHFFDSKGFYGDHLFWRKNIYNGIIFLKKVINAKCENVKSDIL